MRIQPVGENSRKNSKLHPLQSRRAVGRVQILPHQKYGLPFVARSNHTRTETKRIKKKTFEIFFFFFASIRNLTKINFLFESLLFCLIRFRGAVSSIDKQTLAQRAVEIF